MSYVKQMLIPDKNLPTVSGKASDLISAQLWLEGTFENLFLENSSNVTHGTTTLKSPEGVKNVYIVGLHSRPCGLMFSMETVKMDFSGNSLSS